MSQSHFDVIILGASLASRVTGTLLARGGCRVLTFDEPADRAPGWLHSSLHLERLLERLDGRACLTSPSPFQVLTADSRLEFAHPEAVLSELRREFPADHSTAAGLLCDLRNLGQRLEEALWDSGGLPLSGPASRVRFFKQRLRRRLGRASLTQPLGRRLDGLQQASARTALVALFAGLALTSADRLSVAEAALLWNSAVRGQGVSSSALDDLLLHRYRQFHGQTEKLCRLQALQTEGNRLAGATLKGGGRCRASFFLIGSPEDRHLTARHLSPAAPPVRRSLRFTTSLPRDAVSPLLAERVIVGGELPVRLTFSDSGEETVCWVDCAAGDLATATCVAKLQRILAPVLPFATFRLEPCSPERPEPETAPSGPPAKGFPGARGSVRVRDNLLTCHGDGILPSLGTVGEVVTGITVANHLLRTIRHHH